jgi:hypothetical protein
MANLFVSMENIFADTAQYLPAWHHAAFLLSFGGSILASTGSHCD